MRTPETPQSAIRMPLNDILSTPTKVRIIRVLALDQTPKSKGLIASLAEANASGVSRSIDDLIECGVVESIGSGSRRLYCLNSQHQMAPALLQLFEAEQAGWRFLFDRLKSAANTLRPPPLAVWIQGSFVTKLDKLGEVLTVSVFDLACNLDQSVEQLQNLVLDIEQKHDITIFVQGITKADVSLMDEESKLVFGNTFPLLGPPVLDLLTKTKSSKTTIADHSVHDQLALDVSCAVALKLDENPQIVAKAKKHINDCLKTCSAREQKELIEWKRILQSMSIPRLKRFLVDNSERAIRLRQSSPFVGVLSQDELRALREKRFDKK